MTTLVVVIAGFGLVFFLAYAVVEDRRAMGARWRNGATRSRQTVRNALAEVKRRPLRSLAVTAWLAGFGLVLFAAFRWLDSDERQAITLAIIGVATLWDVVKWLKRRWSGRHVRSDASRAL